jgi:pimeloyl-ACP methyl ester carboxylesterase
MMEARPGRGRSQREEAGMNVRKVGKGEHQVVALHGWFGSGDGWGLLPEVVDQDTYTWWFPEMRGYGERRGETGEFTMAEYADDVVAFAASQGLDSYSVVGHSMGGKAAAMVLAKDPEHVRSVVALTPVAPAAMSLDADGEALFFGAAESDDNRRGIIDFTTGGRNSGAWIDAMVAMTREKSDVAAVAGAVTSWIGDDYVEQVGRPDTPICVIVGANDPALNAAYAEQTWQQIYPNVEVVELAETGHYPMFEVPVWLVTQIEKFLARQ